MSKIRRLDRTMVYQGNIIEVYQDLMELPDGSHQTWDAVHHRHGAACVVAVDDEGYILLVKQNRPVLGHDTLELPAGCQDPGEEMIDCAARELLEETGYRAREIAPLMIINSTVATCDEQIDIYEAVAENAGAQHLDPGEEINVVRVKLEDAVEMVLKSEITDSKTAVGILAYVTKNKTF